VDHGDDADDLAAGVAVRGVGARNPAGLSALGNIVGEVRRRDRCPVEGPVQQDIDALFPEVGEDLEGVRTRTSSAGRPVSSSMKRFQTM